jgi:hypothetical protein
MPSIFRRAVFAFLPGTHFSPAPCTLVTMYILDRFMIAAFALLLLAFVAALLSSLAGILFALLRRAEAARLCSLFSIGVVAVGVPLFAVLVEANIIHWSM